MSDVQSRETPRAMGAQNRQRHLEDAAVGLDEAVRALVAIGDLTADDARRLRDSVESKLDGGRS